MIDPEMLQKHEQRSEKKKCTPRTAIVFLCYEDLREIEWIIPTVLKHYDRYKIFVPYKEKSLRTSMIGNFLTSSEGSLHTYTDLLCQSKLGSRFSQLLPSRLHAKIYSLLERSHQRLVTRSIANLISKKIINAIKLEPKTAAYFSMPFCKNDSSFASSTLSELQKRNMPFSAFSINFWGDTPKKISINNIDYICKAPLEQFGRMQPDLIEPFLDFYYRTDHWTQIKEKAKQRKIVVFFTKNMSAFNHLYSLDFRMKYREVILETLRAEGFYIVIKPHPGEKVKHDLKGDHFTISELPSVFLSNAADTTIFELPTNSIFDALMNNKTAYLPLNLMSKLLGKSKVQIINEFPSFFQNVVKEDCVYNCPKISTGNNTQNRIKKYISREMEEA